jgi:hypothetical protein
VTVRRDGSVAAFDELAARFAADARVTAGTGFGANRGFRVDDRIFAIFMGDALTLKLPSARVDALIAAGGAIRIDAGKGRPMREWVTVAAERQAEWASLAEEALPFVSRS